MTDEYFDGDDTGGDVSFGAKSSAGADGGGVLAADTGVDLNGDADECLENEADTGRGEESGEDLNYVSAHDAIAAAAMAHADSPKLPAQLAGLLLPGDYPGGPASASRSHLAQMAIDGGIALSEELMAGAIRQYGPSAESRLRDIQMQIDAQALNNHKEGT